MATLARKGQRAIRYAVGRRAALAAFLTSAISTSLRDKTERANALSQRRRTNLVYL